MTLAGTGVAGTLLPVIATYVVEHHGWRAVGALFAAIMVPLTLFVWHALKSGRNQQIIRARRDQPSFLA